MQNYSFDPDYLRDKYRQERDKRLREDGNDQYQEVSGDFSYFVDDPYINEAIERQALTDSYEIVIIGGGFGGCLLYTSPSPRDMPRSRMPSSA